MTHDRLEALLGEAHVLASKLQGPFHYYGQHLEHLLGGQQIGEDLEVDDQRILGIRTTLAATLAKVRRYTSGNRILESTLRPIEREISLALDAWNEFAQGRQQVQN